MFSASLHGEFGRLRTTNYDSSTWLVNCTDYCASIDVSLECWRCNDIVGGSAVDPLAAAEREAEQGIIFAQKLRFGLVIDATQLGLIRTCVG
jgi:hypothetical protein